jgi:hypothetical protein
VTVRARLFDNDVVGALATPPIGAALTVDAPLAELHAHLSMHAKAELAVQAAQKPDWADPHERLDVLSLSARGTWCNGSAKCSDSVLRHERLPRKELQTRRLAGPLSPVARIVPRCRDVTHPLG